MKDFLKFTFATITGIIVSVVVLVFISILVVFSMVSSSESETQVRKNSIMMLDLNGALAERSQDRSMPLWETIIRLMAWMISSLLSKKQKRMTTLKVSI